jgi:holo-[acyl-carrier protein] synthase
VSLPASAPVAAALSGLALPPGMRLLLGIDTVSVAGVRESMAQFGARFEARLFTAHELHSASRGTQPQREERLAARFAAKEAALKAFGWSNAGIDWRDIEVHTDAGTGQPALALHGRAAELAGRLACGPASLSLSHDGDQAVAIVAALTSAPTTDAALPTPR